jgi:hypothetical protein
MSMHMHRLSFLSVLLGAAALVGCEEDPTPIGPGPIGGSPPTGNQETTISPVRPPAISGGTLMVTSNGLRAVAADPDRDRIVIVDLQSDDVLATIPLEAGAEPGRVVEDSQGRAHVALRGGGGVVTLDLQTGEVLAERAVCTAPRGVATFKPTDEGAETLIVACASGELVELEAAPTGGVVEKILLEPDLRDVVVTGDGTRAGRRLLVSSFRSATVQAIDSDGAVINSGKPSGYENVFTLQRFAPNVAWRMVPTPDGAAMIHQRASLGEVEIAPEETGGYGGQVFDCGSTITNAAVSRFDSLGNPTMPENRGGLGPVLLPVDIAISDQPDPSWGTRLVAAIGAGSDQLMIGTLEQIEGTDACDDNFFEGPVAFVGPEPIAVDFGNADPISGEPPVVVVQIREPAMLAVFDSATLVWKKQIALGGAARIDSGHKLFHRNPELPTTISCASCHPEGGDDSHTWSFTEIGGRRTQSLRGDVTDTAPFHWDGDLEDFSHLMSTVFVDRMGGVPQTDARVDALNTWIAKIPNIDTPEPADSEAVARGKALFESEAVGCATCHSGARLSNNTSTPIGKGKATQVPSLVGIRYRAPFMHDGCAKTLADRFDPTCGGTDHGEIDGLDAGQLDDLVKYMESL